MLSFLRPEKQYRNDTQQRDDKGDKEIVVNGTDVSLQIDTLQYQHLRHFLGCIGRSAPCMFYKPAQGMKGLSVYVSCIVECFAISLRVKSRTLCQQMTEDGYSKLPPICRTMFVILEACAISLLRIFTSDRVSNGVKSNPIPSPRR